MKVLLPSLLGIILIYIAFKKNFALYKIWRIVFCTLFIVAGIHTIHIFQKQKEFTQISQIKNQNQPKNEHFQTPFENELFSYSKNEKNIVVIVLDMFTGSHMPDILEQFPQFKNIFDGFTLFPNAVTSANATAFTMTSLVAGPHYTIVEMNKRRTKVQSDAYQSIANAFTQEGYQVGFLMYPVENREKLIKDPNFFWLDDTQIFENFFLKNNPEIAQTYNKNIEFITRLQKILSFGLFRFSPEFYFREKIYNSGQWIAKNETENIPGLAELILKLSPFYTATHTGNTNSSKPNFKFIYSTITHDPFYLRINENKKCEFYGSTTWKARFGHTEQYETEVCAFFYLQHYFEWLKKENIYNNTQIFIVSDHAGFNTSVNIPPLSPRTIGQDILLMFKDFNSNGELKIDERLMANYDISSIFCDNLKNGCHNVPKNILKNYPKNREIIHARSADASDTKTDDLWRIRRAYKIQGNIFDPAAYTDVSAEYATEGGFAKKK